MGAAVERELRVEEGAADPKALQKQTELVRLRGQGGGMSEGRAGTPAGAQEIEKQQSKQGFNVKQ